MGATNSVEIFAWLFIYLAEFAGTIVLVALLYDIVMNRKG